MPNVDAAPTVFVFNTEQGAEEYLTGLGYVYLYSTRTWVAVDSTAIIVQAPTGKWLVHVMETI